MHNRGPFRVTTDQKARKFQNATLGQPMLDILSDRELEFEMIVPLHWLKWLKAGNRF